MPWYVYAIHQDDTRNRQYHEKPFMDRAAAEELYKEMKGSCFQHDNYRVSMFEANDDDAAEEIADEKRPYPKMKKPAPPTASAVG